MDLTVLELDPVIIRDQQDPVIWYGFLAIDYPDAHVVRLKDDVRAAHARPVVECAAVDIPDPDLRDVVAVIVPVLLQEFVAG